MNYLVKMLTRIGLLKDDLDYHFMRASMVIIYLFFGYQKWFEYEAQELIPFISNGPLISWMYPVLGILEQETGNPWRHRFLFFHDSDLHHYPLDARRLGSLCRRLSRDDRQRR